MDEALKQDIKSAIERSGFPLEHKVGNILREHGWQTISNRYYIDDIKGTEREIDIVAYKIYLDKIEQIEYITTLIISCKKNDKNKWCFLTRKTEPTDANINWNPFHYCTTDDRLDYMAKHHNNILIDSYKSHSGIQHLYSFTENVFAYEKLREPNNDNERGQKGNIITNGNQDIYESIITTIKALNFEKRSRFERYERHPYKRFYSFHLLSIFDGEMVKDRFEQNGSQTIDSIVEIKYLNRHIVNNVDDFYIVNFIQADNFEFRLNLFDYIHNVNKGSIRQLIIDFYKDIFNDRGKYNLLREPFEKNIKWNILGVISDIMPSLEIDDITLWPSIRNDILEIEIGGIQYFDAATIGILNENVEFQKSVKQELHNHLRYDGEFLFTQEELPF